MSPSEHLTRLIRTLQDVALSIPIGKTRDELNELVVEFANATDDVIDAEELVRPASPREMEGLAQRDWADRMRHIMRAHKP